MPDSTIGGPVIKDGKYRLSDKPGLRVELNEDTVRAHLSPGETCCSDDP